MRVKKSILPPPPPPPPPDKSSRPNRLFPVRHPGTVSTPCRRRGKKIRGERFLDREEEEGKLSKPSPPYPIELQEFTRVSFETANPPRRKRVESKVYIPLDGARLVERRTNTIFRYRTSGQPPRQTIYIYISGEDNPVLSTLDSQRLYRLLEDLLFRLTSFFLLLPSLASLSHRRTRCSNYYRHFRCPENCNSTVLQFSRGETIVEREG